MDPRGVGLVSQTAVLVLGVPWTVIEDIVVEDTSEFTRRASLEPLAALAIKAEPDDACTYVTVLTAVGDHVVFRSRAARSHVVRGWFLAPLLHFPQRRPPGLENEPAPLRIEEIPIFEGRLRRPYRVVEPVKASTRARTAISPRPTKHEADMKLREAAAKVGANAVIDARYVRGVSSVSWNQLTVLGTAVVVDVRDGDLRCDTSAQPIYSPDRGHWWEGSAWVDAARRIPPGVALSTDGATWWDGRSWRRVPAGAGDTQATTSGAEPDG